MIEFPVVLVINCGSSSVKFSVLDAAGCDALMTGIADGINTEKAFISVNWGEPVRLAHQTTKGRWPPSPRAGETQPDGQRGFDWPSHCPRR